MAGRGTENTCIHSGDLKSKVWGGGAPWEHLFQQGGEVEVEGAEGHLLPGPITHAGKILSDYEARAWIPTYGRSCREEGEVGGGGRYLR